MIKRIDPSPDPFIRAVVQDRVREPRRNESPATIPSTHPQRRDSCRLTDSDGQSIVTATLTAINFDGEYYDNGGLHDNSVNNTRITVPPGSVSSAWIFWAIVHWGANATGRRELSIRKNGSSVLATVRTAAYSGTELLPQELVISDVDARPGDYYEIIVLQDSGVNVTIQSGVLLTFAAIQLW